ncbi:MAG: hypothetical protein RLZZ387_1295 [Chloroflexota bacterium]|jgi:uncharacterized membrane-anchored protein YjiN (DUF445 family)
MVLAEERARQAELDRMKRIATGLLVVAALVFVVAKRFESVYPWLGFVRAAAEGAMVGALADWFAVTALFRHPLGLPIPHTAIIPRRKDSIGASIGRFVQDNFLTPEVIAERLRAVSVARRAGAWLARPESATRVGRILAGGAAGVLRVVNDADVQALIERSVVSRLETTPAAPTLGRLLGAVLVGDRRREALFALVQITAQLIIDNQESIRQKIVDASPWWMPRGVDRTIYIRLVETVTATMIELSQDPDHPLNAHFDEVVERFVERLQSDSELIARGETYKAELVGHPFLRELAASLWQDAKALLLEQSTRDDSALRETIARGLVRIGELLQRDETLAAKVDAWVEAAVLYAAREYGDEGSELIAQTVSRWDAESTSRRIELQVGRDLQFIRINGTVVGGLAGLAIYGLGTFLR